MKKIVALFLILLLAFSCNQKKKEEVTESAIKPAQKEIKKPEATGNLNVEKSKMIDPDPDDGVPPERYSPHNSNIKVAQKIKGFLVNDILKDDLKAMSKADRKFKYEEVDLNRDGKNEYLVGFSTPYFCGTGGCTYYLLNNDGSVITVFSVSEAPFIALRQRTNGWRDLLVRSNGKLRILKFDGKTYPSNPSVEPEFKEIPSDDAYRLLWDEFPIPTFKF